MSSQRGSMTGEVVVLIPALMMIVLLVVYAGRLMQTSTQIQQVADVAAREASTATRRSSLRVAIAATQREMTLHNLSCERAQVSTRQSMIEGLAAVHVTVTCSLSVKELLLLRVPARTLKATSIAVVDRYRSR